MANEITTQCDQILQHMRAYGSITPLDALRQYGCMRLGARIWDLRQRNIMIKSRSVRRGKKVFASYSLVEA